MFKRAILLGGSGFIGRNLMEHLRSRQLDAVSVSSSQIDLCREDAVKELEGLVQKDDALVILSAVTPDKGRDVHTQMKNLKMGETLYSFFEKKSCAHVIYVSSDAVYADAVQLVKAGTPCEPGSFYGITHLARERMLTDVLKKPGTPLLILRPSILYGSDDTHQSYGPNRFFKSARTDGKISLFGNGEEKRDHVYVEDVCAIIGEALVRQSSGIHGIATGRSVSFMEVALLIKRLFEDRLRIETSPRANPISHRHFDVTGLLKAFPDFQPTALEDGLAETYKAIFQNA